MSILQNNKHNTFKKIFLCMALLVTPFTQHSHAYKQIATPCFGGISRLEVVVFSECEKQLDSDIDSNVQALGIQGSFWVFSYNASLLNWNYKDQKASFPLSGFNIRQRVQNEAWNANEKADIKKRDFRLRLPLDISLDFGKELCTYISFNKHLRPQYILFEFRLFGLHMFVRSPNLFVWSRFRKHMTVVFDKVFNGLRYFYTSSFDEWNRAIQEPTIKGKDWSVVIRLDLIRLI